MVPFNPKTARRLDFIVHVAYVAVIIGLILIGIKWILGWVLPFLLAFCLVSLLRPLTEFIRKKLRIRQSVVSVAIVFLIYAGAGTALFFLILQLVTLARYGFEVLPEYYSQSIAPSLEQAWSNILAFLAQLPPEVQAWAVDLQDGLIGGLQGLLADFSQKGIAWLSGGVLGSVAAFFVGFVFTIMLSFFISMQYDKVIGFFRTQLPGRALRVFSDLRSIVGSTIASYLKACLTLMLITFLELSVGLLVLGADSAIPIAAGIAVFDALPVFGTGAIVVPWVLVELIQGNFPFALGLGILYAIVTVVRNIIEPKIVGDNLGLNPIVSMVSIYVGFRVMSVGGMILMPILTQILLELHKKGSISLLRRQPEEADGGEDAPAEASPKEDAPDGQEEGEREEDGD